MNEKIIYCGDVESTVHFEDNLEIHNIIWTVPDIMELLKKVNGGHYSQELQPLKQDSNPTETSSEDKILLNIMLKNSDFGKNCSGKVIDIGYMSRTPAFVRYFLMKMFTFNLKTWDYSEQEQTIFTKERVTAKAQCQPIGCLRLEGQYESLGFQPVYTSDLLCLVTDNDLCLNFKFAITTKTKLVCKIPISRLSEDWEKLLIEGLYYDAIMTSTEGEEFRVHKVVLASRCEVLKAHFEHNTTETTTNIVKSNLKSAVLREVLFFIYSDRAKVDKDPERLLAAADYYQLSRLKSLCEDSLHRKLNANNALEILELADLHNAETLKKITEEFVKRNDLAY